MKKLMMILSGGQDSTTALFLAKKQFKEIHTTSFHYGQRHKTELIAAGEIARLACVKSHNIIDARDILVSSSPLTSDSKLHQYSDYESMVNKVGSRVENTFVPMRNTFFAVIAANRALALGCTHIGLGVCESDSANYPDCTGAYLDSLQSCITKSLSSGPKRYIEIYAPLVNLTKAEAIKLAYKDTACWRALAFTQTSYDGKYPPTDNNHANLLRAQGFQDADLPDPLVVRAAREGLMSLPRTKNYDSLRKEFK